MTAFAMESTPAPRSVEFVPAKNPAIRRKSRHLYELLNPKKPEGTLTFDTGQVKQIVLMDKRLREEGIVRSVPAGYAEFASRFNQYATGPERFATYSFENGRYRISKDGKPVRLEQFLIDEPVAGPSTERKRGDSSSNPFRSDSAPSPVAEETDEDIQLNALSSHMNGALETMDELTKFWTKRGAIEHEYASRLAQLAETPIGKDQPKELLNAIDAFRIEAARQSMCHHKLSQQLAIDIESRYLNFHMKQQSHWRDVYEPTARFLREKPLESPLEESGISRQWRREYRNLRHDLDAMRLDSVMESHGLSQEPSSSRRFSAPPNPRNMPAIHAKSWKNLRDSCEKLETERYQLLKTTLGVFADAMATVRAADDESCERLRASFDLYNPTDSMESFGQTCIPPPAAIEETVYSEIRPRQPSSIPRPVSVAVPHSTASSTEEAPSDSPRRHAPEDSLTTYANAIFIVTTSLASTYTPNWPPERDASRRSFKTRLHSATTDNSNSDA
ncbi:hypothetical protein NLJ89_g9164 [Agrocybe chaxingu]|uniref:FCH domain-containing protein n=1 Tax=Agrocybe chaxingu TaxID=84603 RepID=A0A9W8JTL0_9AGAR|nr:hypothetical protein NLJ89_g9164 [Agrocybe chaxingu]